MKDSLQLLKFQFAEAEPLLAILLNISKLGELDSTFNLKGYDTEWVFTRQPMLTKAPKSNPKWAHFEHSTARSYASREFPRYETLIRVGLKGFLRRFIRPYTKNPKITQNKKWHSRTKKVVIYEFIHGERKRRFTIRMKKKKVKPVDIYFNHESEQQLARDSPHLLSLNKCIWDLWVACVVNMPRSLSAFGQP